MKIRIKDLRLRCIIGLHDWEREVRQDVVINIEIEFDNATSASSDDISDSINYKKLTKEIIGKVEKSDFKLIERLAGMIVETVMSDERVGKVIVEIDKPHALRFADSVSVELTGER